MDNKEIGAILRQARKKAGISREMVAEMVGKSDKMVGHWETGHSSVDANTLFALCQLYGIDMNEAFGFPSKPAAVSPPPPPVPQDLTAEMERLLQTLSPEQAALLCAVAAKSLQYVNAKEQNQR